MSEVNAGRRGVSVRLVAVWGVVLALAAAIVAIQLTDRARERREDAAPVSRDQRLLLPVALQEVGAVEVLHAGALHRFERDAAGAWLYHGAHAAAGTAAHQHAADPARAARIDTALQAFGRTRIERTLTEPGLAPYGLAAPQMVILVYRPNEARPLLQVAVGDVAPDRLSRYVTVPGRADVLTIANYQIDNLLGLIEAMKAG